jgi:DNA-directed RNA polymerase specialized sigma24 family protein
MIRMALQGDPQAARALVDRLTPVVQARVTRGLLRRGPGAGRRDVRQEVEDFTQEVFLSLFRDGGRALLAWDATRGLSFENFVGLLAAHQVASILRTGKSSPWVDLPTETEILERQEATGPAPDQIASTREMWDSLLSRLVTKLSPRGLEMFWRLLVREEDVDLVCADTGMTADAIYAWRSRLARLARSLAAEQAREEAATASRASGGGQL